MGQISAGLSWVRLYVAATLSLENECSRRCVNTPGAGRNRTEVRDMHDHTAHVWAGAT